MKPVNFETADDLAMPILKAFQERYGMVPNFYGALGIDGASLKGYLAFEEAIEERCLLSERQRELISLAVANRNGCHYCVSGHTFSARKLGMSQEECRAAQGGEASDPLDQGMLDLALDVMENSGACSSERKDRCRALGMSDALIMQVVAWTGINNFSNWVNNLVQPKIDFPKVELTSES
ncbi:carboxymuconolactone decarboxylase family protein [Halomonas pacifica]|uniref:Alkyl hydroperoxide reductase AhpD n=1 Tax=Bisbaumannia pacifica TaxID=77098 RepID=A0A510X789_9GAMM|nr:carboxymuconolactone decarboxylase family protein [Halomonas pacifica]MBH8579523.1 carboxymuconolactone decarboxylase family protein [Halomonas pacifica]MDC8802637.1 carboxymuconolactone decarboxylase family protein [Halomonas pacifica]GEK47308.1 alkyl hydroperoxide reductase AhpD [Halomonas pacifica]